MAYQITLGSVHTSQDLTNGGQIVGRMFNRGGRWIAHKVELSGWSHRPIGDGVDVTRVINARDGAEQVASALGL